jgi:hypothetical protein
LCRIEVSQRQRRLSDLQLLILEQMPLLHALDFGSEPLELLEELDRP